MDDNYEERRGRGRPLKEDRFDQRMEIRMKSPEINMLNEIMDETDQTRSDIVRSAIRYYYVQRPYRRRY